MPIDVTQVIVGAGTLEVDGVDVGATRDGVEMSRAIEFYDVQCDQVKATLKKAPTNQKRTVKTTLLEATLENLKLAWGGTLVTSAGPPATKTLKMGLADGGEEHELVFVGPAPGTYKTRTVTFYRAVNVSQSATKYVKDGEVRIEVEFEILPDLSKPAGEEWGTIVDSE